MSIYLVVEPVRAPLHGVIPMAPDATPVKNALILGAFAEGDTVIRTQGIVHSPAVDDTVQALEQLGVSVSLSPRGYVVHGQGKFVARSAERVDLGRSEWTPPLLLGIGAKLVPDPEMVIFEPIAGISRDASDGAHSLLDQLGRAHAFEAKGQAYQVTPGSQLGGGSFRVPPTLESWIAPLLMVAPLAREPVTIEADPTIPHPSVWGVGQLLRAFGIFLDENDAGGWWRISAPQRFHPADVGIGPDSAQTAFLLVLAAIHAGSLKLTQLGELSVHPVIRPMLDILRAMGAPFKEQDGEITLTQSACHLTAGRFDLSSISRLLPVLAVAAAMARGTTRLEGIDAKVLAEPGVRAIRETLTLMGAEIEVTESAWTIHGGGRLQGGLGASPQDPIEFLALVLAGTVTDQPLSITPPWGYLGQNPHFFDVLGRVGIATTLRAINVGLAEVR